ncbi:ATP-dependent endonuclease [Streptomyces sp. NPDC057580]|uniref:ATP-dependent nuclease n=1 Tax=Streptomyces sp. NPDC057580 TaxID=3346173 RepID=UPI003678576B
MQVRRIQLQNFRGVKSGTITLDGHSLLAGSNSAGKSTICEALDLTLGPERMLRRPVIDEYDFYGAEYQEHEGELPEVRIEVVLTDLSDVAQRRFGSHLRRWSRQTNEFLDLVPDAVSDPEAGEWCLPIVFIGRYDPQEDDFTGGTFFAHPENPVEVLAEEEVSAPGAGLKPFTRTDKRHCGFIYLRPNRTGNRALTFQRGSLLDTIVRLEAELAGPLWENTLRSLDQVVIAAADSGFGKIRTEIHERISRFVSLGDSTDPVDFRASEITREHLRDVLRLFIATQPSTHSVPFNRLSTGSLNLLVFAMLTYIAELKGDKSVIFAIEEPEIALPPHAQRRLVDFVIKHMGQVIVTSHSPYVIEKFEPSRTVVIARDSEGTLTSTGVTLPEDFKPSKYRLYRRQFAEAVLARAVLVVEGATEAALFPAVSDVLEADPSVPDYVHIDLAGVTVFDAQSDVNVPLFAPVFKALNKPVYGIHDQPKKPLEQRLLDKAAGFSHYVELSYKSVEKLLVAEVPVAVQRRFLSAVSLRDDYPSGCAKPSPGVTDDQVRSLTTEVLLARKGDGYAALLITECNGLSELPGVLAGMLLLIDLNLRPAQVSEAPSSEAAPSADATDED